MCLKKSIVLEPGEGEVTEVVNSSVRTSFEQQFFLSYKKFALIQFNVTNFALLRHWFFSCAQHMN